VWSDTGPREDGTRSARQWLNAIDEDIGIMTGCLVDAVETSHPDLERAQKFAIALKEARRLQSDIYRFADEVFKIPREVIDSEGPL